jgi:hypothetical protein
MYEHNQIEVPAAFMALYCRHGRPVEARAVIEARYEACEDLAQGVAGFCKALQFKDDLPEAEVLQRCLAGLRATPETVSEAEAGWVVARAAELLEWQVPPDLAGPP